MKNIILLFSFYLLFSLTLQAQEEKRPEAGRIEALKIAYLTRKLNLSTDEAQKFWPVYNSYANEMRRAHQDMRENKGGEIEREEKMLGIRKKFNGEFNKALSSDKVNEFFRAEREFNGIVQKEIMERRQQRMDGRNRGRFR
jgi:hypothetical protein